LLRLNLRGRHVAQNQPVDLRLFYHLAAAMIDQTGIVIAGDPCPARRARQGPQHILCPGGQALAAGGVVEAVPQAPDFPGVGRCDQSGQVRKRGDRVVGRQHLPETGKPARFFEM
jgi:hypothetical protein